ncbi:MAG: RNA polymerase sigma-70 factor [Actinomycetota bacterium]|nr:RNA polymerase sigma-70 factor [Actinomycetota bacterium]
MNGDHRVEVFEDLRPRMFGLAYRMLGSVADAEDIVQEAFLRWRNAEDVREPAAFLTTVVTRLCLDHLKSARARRERYVGPWLPEPLLVDQMPDAAEAAELSDSLSMAFLMVLESLTPAERAAFLLREVFGYEYREIANLLRTSEANVRQLVHRAKDRIGERRQRFAADKEKQRELLGRFLLAISTGEVDALVELLAEDAVCYTDGGGEVRAARRPIYGPDKIARFLSRIVGDMPVGLESQVVEANGAPAVLLRDEEGAWGVVTADASDDKVGAIYILLNPKKLAAIGRSSGEHPASPV